jgi:hypothetical protein
VEGKSIAANLEDHPLADYVLRCAQLRKFDDALRRMRFSVRCSAIPGSLSLLSCELPRTAVDRYGRAACKRTFLRLGQPGA